MQHQHECQQKQQMPLEENIVVTATTIEELDKLEVRLRDSET